MQNYDSDALNEMCEKIDLLEYASQSMEFEYRSGNYFASCPRHIDETPSLSINPEVNKFYCFSCGVGGGIIKWLMTFEHMTFDNAVDKVANMVGADIKKLKTCEAMSFYKSIQKSVEGAKIVRSDEVRKILPKSEAIRFSKEVATEWVEEGIDPEVMKKYEIMIDHSSNRIVYPVYDKDFNLIGFKGRTRFKNYKEMKIQKYMNYSKIGTVDFFIGMKQNRDSILKHNTAIIFEGIKSVMKADQWGYDYALAAETSVINDEQAIILIQMGIKNVIIAFDSDVSMDKIQKCTSKLRKFLNVYVVTDKNRLLGSKDDKMSPVDKGKEVWETLLSQKVKL